MELDSKNIHVESLIKLYEQRVRAKRFEDLGQNPERARMDAAVMNNFHMNFRTARAKGARLQTYRDKDEAKEGARAVELDKTLFERHYQVLQEHGKLTEAEVAEMVLDDGHSFKYIHQTKRNFYRTVDRAAADAGLDLEQIAEDLREGFENNERFHENRAKLMPAFKMLLRRGYNMRDLR